MRVYYESQRLSPKESQASQVWAMVIGLVSAVLALGGYWV